MTDLDETKTDVSDFQGIEIDEEEIQSDTHENEIKEHEIDFEEEEFWSISEKLQRIHENDAETPRLDNKDEVNATKIETERCVSLGNDKNYLLVDSKVNQTYFKKCSTADGKIIQAFGSGKITKLKLYQCKACECGFDNEYQLINHAVSFHGKEKPFKCLECDYLFSEKDNLIKHMRCVHSPIKEKPFKCTECDYLCSGKEILKIHVRTIHKKEKSFKCIESDSSNISCIQRFSSHKKSKVKTKKKVIKHGNWTAEWDATKYDIFVFQGIKIEEAVNEQKIDFEEEKFWLLGEEKLQRIEVNDTQTARLANSDDLHATKIEAERLKVPQNKENETSPSIIPNIENHDGTKMEIEHENVKHVGWESSVNDGNYQHKKVMLKSFQCNSCDCYFDRKDQLANHAASVHGKEKPFKCTECDYSCCRNGSLARHVKSIHRKEKPFMCAECDYSCSDKGNFVIHVKSVHRKEKPFTCAECDYSCSRKSHLVRHVKAVHRKEMGDLAMHGEICS